AVGVHAAQIGRDEHFRGDLCVVFWNSKFLKRLADEAGELLMIDTRVALCAMFHGNRLTLFLLICCACLAPCSLLWSLSYFYCFILSDICRSRIATPAT